VSESFDIVVGWYAISKAKPKQMEMSHSSGCEVARDSSDDCRTPTPPHTNEPRVAAQEARHLDSRDARYLDDGVMLSSEDDSMDAEVGRVLHKVTDWKAFDVFRLAAASGGHPLRSVTLHLLQQLGVISRLRLSLEKLSAFLDAVEVQYGPQPYHNSVHAADVVQALGAMMAADSWAAGLTDIEVLVVIIAAAVHDLGHPGVNNDFHARVNTKAAQDFALKGSINENGHASLALGTLSLQENDFLQPLGPALKAEFEDALKDLVLSTDMANHQSVTEEFSSTVRRLGPDLKAWPASTRRCALRMLLHCADISNPARPLARCREWGRRVQEELFSQGDLEREMGLDVTRACDRSAATPAENQAAFIRFVMRPCITELAAIAPLFVAEVMPFVEASLSHWEATGGMKRGDEGATASTCAGIGGSEVQRDAGDVTAYLAP
jgi:calcium/calmodulin-dependent 3',5'-cyclic nucleotide phosphodiesterase